MTAQLKIVGAERKWGWPVLKNLLRGAGVFVMGAALAMLVSPIAAAHISVELDGAGPGEFGLISIRVPTESGAAATTKVQVRIPEDVQLRTVLAGPVAGWSIDIKKRTIPPIYKDDGTPVTEVVDSVTWTATGPGIAPGQFGQFALDVGPLPDAATLALPTVQTFSDGTVKDWSQTEAEGEDPEFPVPTVTIGAASGAENGASTVASVIPWAALGFSVIALALGVFAIDRAAASRRSTGVAAGE
ncbi:MAG: YcnI family protein [Actinomycetia bacterium]|nr:YcnI family protein [Actinomycetes bacterium]